MFLFLKTTAKRNTKARIRKHWELKPNQHFQNYVITSWFKISIGTVYQAGYTEPFTYPSFCTILMSLRLTLSAVDGSITLKTASTDIGARRLEYWETTWGWKYTSSLFKSSLSSKKIQQKNWNKNHFTLELNDVIALFSNDSRSLRVTGVDMFVSMSTALAAAFSKDSDIVVGWIPTIQTTLFKTGKNQGKPMLVFPNPLCHSAVLLICDKSLVLVFLALEEPMC